ncbi:MAG TPA: DUF4384 domain-containing protein [Stellaceae bacterium]
MRRQKAALAALILWAAAGMGCGVVRDSFELTDAQQVVADMKLGPSELRIIGAVDHADRSYRVGETIALTAEVNNTANVAVLRVMPNGATTLLFPNKEHPSAEVPANTSVKIGGGAVDKPGTVLFEFIAAKSGDSFLFDKKRAEEGTHAELGATTRALAKDIMMSLKPGSARETAAARILVRVE